MKRILVTGGAGFLGSNLCERLLEEGNYVICADNLYTGSTTNIDHLKSNSNFEFLEHDIEKPLDIEVDEIYNLACPASPIHYQKDHIKTLRTSVFGIINMLDLAKKNNAKLFHTSTSEVYGDPKVHPQPESYWGNVNCFGERSCYDEGKRVAESFMYAYHKQFGVKIKIVRIFNTYGPRLNPKDGRVVSNFIVQALKGEDITIYGDGMQTRSFCYVTDLLDIMVQVMDSEDDFIGPVNIGNSIEFTMKELAEIVLQETGSSSKIVYEDLPADDPKVRRPDISFAKEKFGWEPKISLREGIKKSIPYFKSAIGLD